MIDHKIIDVHRGSQSESWLVIYAEGRIKYHIENDGHAFLRHGPEAHDEWIDLAHVRNYWPHLVTQVEAAIAELTIEAR